MNAQIEPSQLHPNTGDQKSKLPQYKQLLLAVDSSDHSNRSLLDTLQLASLWGSDVTAAHVYAAKLHDVRFRQMEGGLPEQFREEDELERQRDVHDDLITRGLSIITDSYLDHSERQCQKANINFKRCGLEGKNYRELAHETNNGFYDLLVMGALGLGAIQGSRVGTVCQRVLRRSNIDCLVIKQPERSIVTGPIVVAIDGSTKAYGALLTAFSLAQRWQIPVKIIAAFDPYFHYVAFNRIADVLSEEAGKVFRFQEQEKLHEEIIDSGLAKIYQGHLDVAESIAKDLGLEKMGVKIETKLLDGKPHDAIEKYLQVVKPSLLVVGKLGIHADAELDIGGTSENLLHNTECAILFSQREYKPRVDMVAETTTSWTTQAEERMNKVPEFVRGMARMAILRYSQEKGHTVITERIVEDATAQLCPGHAREAMAEIVAAHDSKQQDETSVDSTALSQKIPPMRWSYDATELLLNITELSVRGNIMLRAEKRARQQKRDKVSVEHVSPFLDNNLSNLKDSTLHWQAAALARLAQVPQGIKRDSYCQQIEDYARTQNLTEINLETADAALQHTTQINAKSATESSNGKCPFAQHSEPATDAQTAPDNTELTWTKAAQARMQKVPAGFMRDLTRQRIETFAKRNGATEITPQLIDDKYRDWGEGSEKQQQQMSWSNDAMLRIERIPDFVRGMVIKEVERCSADQGADTVTTEILEQAMSKWQGLGVFHSETEPDLYKE